jgi:hypothetical protein
MSTINVQARSEALLATQAQKAKAAEANEPAVETKSDNDQDDSTNLSNETIKLSDTSLKLASSKITTSSPVQSSDKSAPIENKDQAQQVLNQLKFSFQNNPTEALGAHSNVFAEKIKSLLG